VKPGETPTGQDLFAAIGGVRGVIESVVPGFVFLVVFTVTGELLPSVVAPVGVAVLALLVRLIQRLPVIPAVSGGIGIALSAGFALWTGRAEDNFVGGFIINSISLTVVVVSLLVRRPFVGVIASLISPEIDWKSAPRAARAVRVATVMWGLFFALRLTVQVPLYFAGATAALASTKLIMGLPFYAAMLWVTWLLLRSVSPPTSPA
jgi:hypothetical protein